RYAPDGARIAFAGSSLDGLRPPASGPASLRLGLGWPGLGDADADAITARRGVQRHGLPTDPWLVAPDGTGLGRVDRVAGDDLAVAWSPDGQWLALSGAYGLSVVGVADGAERASSPDGSFGALDWR